MPGRHGGHVAKVFSTPSDTANLTEDRVSVVVASGGHVEAFQALDNDDHNAMADFVDLRILRRD